ncbi:hypothetical protein AC1031_002216 [Aphanomyces cochlioides]|nr:hypothetical protein AC1031_002216 [Aphanomyces cochlioides]
MEHKLATDSDLDLLLLLDDQEGYSCDTNEESEANRVVCSDIHEVCSIILATSICSSTPDSSSDSTPAHASAPSQQRTEGGGKEVIGSDKKERVTFDGKQKQEIKRLRDEVNSLKAEL